MPTQKRRFNFIHVELNIHDNADWDVDIPIIPSGTKQEILDSLVVAAATIPTLITDKLNTLNPEFIGNKV